MDLKGKDITPEERKIIIKLRNESKTLREIGKIVGRTHSSIQRVINNYTSSKSIISKPRSGRPSKLTAREKRYVFKSAFEGAVHQRLFDGGYSSQYVTFVFGAEFVFFRSPRFTTRTRTLLYSTPNHSSKIWDKYLTCGIPVKKYLKYSVSSESFRFGSVEKKTEKIFGAPPARRGGVVCRELFRERQEGRCCCTRAAPVSADYVDTFENPRTFPRSSRAVVARKELSRRFGGLFRNCKDFHRA
ncbi:uncharacterized protein CEXT_588921 [Caerostris extrusa]|uniref:Transposase IS30-like HTH domain-containing protein n=1 Tax=Caerostris extrusa TaxID=172846 RepID=A0AAV4TRX8_CAEEX|nr:uncharacterized protein CEXT_588921 [Caerostris extrusa]